MKSLIIMFQFPSNGKAESKYPNVWEIMDYVSFQFPSNGKAESKTLTKKSKNYLV